MYRVTYEDFVVASGEGIRILPGGVLGVKDADGKITLYLAADQWQAAYLEE